MTDDDDPRSMTPGDREVLEAANGLDASVMILDAEDLTRLTKEAVDQKARFDGQVADMTPAQALLVRQARVVKGYTWRAVAAAYAEAFGGAGGGNQIAGMAICERAAALCGEDWLTDPWN